MTARGQAAQIFVSRTTSRGRFLLAAVRLEDADAAAAKLERLRQDLLTDRFRSRLPSVPALRDRPFRYAEDHDAVRDDVIGVLRAVSFKTDLWLSAVDDAANRGKTSDPRLLRLVAFRAACMGFRAPDVALVVGPAVRQKTLQTNLDDLAARVLSSRTLVKRRKASSLTIRLAEPGELGLVAPDYVVGVVADAMACGTSVFDEEGTRRVQARFAALAPRLGHVEDLTGGISYRGGAFAREIDRLRLRS